LAKNVQFKIIVPIKFLLFATNKIRKLEIRRGTIVSRKTLAKNRISYGFSDIFSKLKKEKWYRKIIEPHTAFFVISGSSSEADFEKEIDDHIKILEHELSIFRSSFLYRNRGALRKRKSPRLAKSYLVLSKRKENSKTKFEYSIAKEIYGGLPYFLDDPWVEAHKEYFFSNFLKALQGGGKPQYGKEFIKCIERAMVLVGDSLAEDRQHYAFLLNMIALETLLLNQGSKVRETVEEYMEGIFRWSHFHAEQNLEFDFRDLYRIRNDIVHDGIFENVKSRYLDVLDQILLNLIANIMDNPTEYRNKEAIKEQVKKYQAAETLKLNGNKFIPKKASILLRPPVPDNL